MANGIMVVCEMWNSEFRKITFEVLSKAKAMADEIGEPLTAVALGNGISETSKTLAGFGADVILTVDDPALKTFRPFEYEAAICELIRTREPRIVLFGATNQGREISALAAAGLRAGLASECSGLEIEEGRLVADRPLYGGKVTARVDIAGTPQMASVRPNLFEITENPGKGEVKTVNLQIPAPDVELLEEKIEMSGKAELTEADYIVSGGRGMESEDFQILESLAASLGGAVGASRNAVDLGWRPQSDQVGQTGKVVSPKLYIACGISGAQQHVAGMNTADVIVGINNDPDALIFKVADYAVVDDLFEIVPALTEEIEKLKKSS